MVQITINGKQYESYASVDEANDYLGGATYGAEWNEETDVDTKGRCLVTATRWIDSIAWAGTKTNPAQLLAWPRTGISGVDPDTIPEVIVNACIELANMLLTEPELQSDMSQVSAKRLKAGSVEIEYFRGATVETLTPFPTLIMRMLSGLLAPGGSLSRFGRGSIATGVHYCSKFNQPYTFTEAF